MEQVMKLILNLSMLGPQPTGLGVYSENCTRHLGDRFSLGLIAGAGNLPQGEVLAKAPDAIAIGGGKLAALKRQWWMRSLRFGEDALVYSPTHHGLPQQHGQIITIHDLICLRFPKQHRPQYLFFRFGLPRLLKTCRAVFTVSETTRRDVADTYAYPLERIFVVPNGVDVSSFSPDASAKPQEPYLLMVGARYPHKNVDEVLDMARYWKDAYRLVVTSCGGSYRSALENKVADLGLSGRVEFKDYLSREQLIKLYQGASALVYPSRWEGFGIPPLEALACGTPVVASDIPVHREVLGESAQFVELGKASSWAEAFERIGDPREVDAMLKTAPGLLGKFTWRNAADTLERSLLCVEPRLDVLRHASSN